MRGVLCADPSNRQIGQLEPQDGSFQVRLIAKPRDSMSLKRRVSAGSRAVELVRSVAAPSERNI
jgi:hypothetical protein